MDIESFVLKLYKYFHIYTVRTEQVKEFCEFVDIDYLRLLNTNNTRWLSLLAAVDRVLKLFPVLRSYFLSQSNPPTAIVSFFENPLAEVWLWFLCNQLSLFSDTIKEMEKQNASVIDIARQITQLIGKLKERRDACFMGLKVKELLKSLKEQGLLPKPKVCNSLCAFYNSSIDYLEEWGAYFADLNTFSWILLNTVLVWDNVEMSLLFVKSVSSTLQINEMELFDEITWVRKCTADRLIEWNDQKKTADERWMEIFDYFQNQNITFKNTGLMV
ncbi:hypothetical protein NDU88_002769 [Pleurodeles waltl]|uniref:Uncharacterized protein n=1 Tax=Pleurodeles waltl TaxID=8319 RepID=A0AAV7SBX8_PLEWA|nr:hypothetical protein NDU88_002769 [Pleurodeles waltl]